MQISKGVINSALKVVVYGPEGVGKSTLATQFPTPVFIDTEGSTKFLDVARTPKPSSWVMLLEQVQYFITNQSEYKTLVIDTADWAEMLCVGHLCAKSKKDGLEDFGYGKGYTYLAEEFARLLALLERVVDEAGMNVVLTAHAAMRKFEQPEETGAYDRWELKLQKKTAPLVKEWADMVLFANYKVLVVNVDNQGAQKGKNKAQGGKRVMHTTHNPCWDAKNRHGLKDELPFDYAEIAHCFSTVSPSQPAPPAEGKTADPSQQQPEQGVEFSGTWPPGEGTAPPLEIPEGIPKSVADLMIQDGITGDEIRKVVAEKGFCPEDTPFTSYPPEFFDGWIVPNWAELVKYVMGNYRDLPF